MTDPDPVVAANAVILGCGRSGTSIFGELFAAFTGYRYWSEPLLDDLPSPPSGPIAVKVPRTAEGDDPPPGLSTSLQALWAAVPDPRVVFWQVRHPLDAICSLRVGIADNWGHHPRPHDWQDWLDRPLVEQCAHHWATVNSAGYEHVRPFAVVNHFEDLIADPRACAERAAGLLGADPTTPEVTAWCNRVQDTDNEQFIEAETSRARSRRDHLHRVGRWRENLTAAEVDAVRPIVAAAAATFGYAL
jgi:hypothetical protein